MPRQVRVSAWRGVVIPACDHWRMTSEPEGDEPGVPTGPDEVEPGVQIGTKGSIREALLALGGPGALHGVELPTGIGAAEATLAAVEPWASLYKTHDQLKALEDAANAMTQQSLSNLVAPLPPMPTGKSHMALTNELLGGLIAQGEAREAEDRKRRRTDDWRFWLTASLAAVAAVTGLLAVL